MLKLKINIFGLEEKKNKIKYGENRGSITQTIPNINPYCCVNI